MLLETTEAAMEPLVIADELRFNAELVAAQEEIFTPDFIVHGIYFGEGDPEQGGQHWNFTRSLDDEDGVCIVKEIQEVTVYGGILSFKLSRRNLRCEFSDTTARHTQTRRLMISFEISDKVWEALVTQSKLVFQGEDYFELER
jgi:hypothetical protein